ncbi:hypothetical protein CUMW_210750 [Citrus unshiu]|uniref:Uncharacterized protein n=1 Tax=Citrus unshiu TaxID=55188 RepID=A0A2H5QAF1_CITUN|nr:hypothetical protein CUMW_210750 [Citrus unshiu]
MNNHLFVLCSELLNYETFTGKYAVTIEPPVDTKSNTARKLLPSPMAFTLINRTTRHRVFAKNRFFFSTKPYNSQILKLSFSNEKTNYRMQISLANLLQRYGFPPSQLHSFISKNQFLLNSNNLNDLDKSLSILLSFKITQKSLVSLINDCPGVLDVQFLKKWEVGVLKFGDLGLSPLVVRNFLELSRRFEIDPDGVFHTMKVLKGLGFSEGTLNRVLEEFPRVILMNEGEVCRKIEFFEGIGISGEGIERIFSFFPAVIGFDVEDRLKPLLDEFCHWGFGEDMIRKEIVREPRVLSMELGEFSRCLELLRSLKCREPIKWKIFGEGAFRAGFEVKLRVDCLCKHGLIRREAFKVLWKEPRVMTYRIEDIEKKIEFLVHRMKFNVDCLVEVPEFLGVNFDKHIVPRYNVIGYLRGKGGLGSEVGLKDLIKPSRLRFYNLYVKPYPECEKLYGRFSGGEVKSRHPVGLWKLFKPPSYPESKEDVRNMKAFMETLV